MFSIKKVKRVSKKKFFERNLKLNNIFFEKKIFFCFNFPIGYRSNPRTLTSTSHEVLEDVTPAVPSNLAPGPNTKVTTTVKTYTYELPGAPDSYMNSSLAKNVDKSVSYSSTKDPGIQKTITYEVISKKYKFISKN